VIGYVLNRLAASIVVLWAVATLVFGMLQLAPGDAAQVQLGVSARPEDLAALRARMGLDRPLHLQYVSYMFGLVRGDLGSSLFSGQPVRDLLWDRAPTTIELALVTVFVSSAIAILLGVVSAATRDSALDGAIRIATVIGISIPTFWSGLLVLLVFGLYVPGVLPAGGWVPFFDDPLANLRHLILPVTVLSLAQIAIISRTLRISMFDVLSSDYVLFARAMGLPQRSVLRSVALPNAIIPTTTLIGLAVASLTAGAVVTEVVFTIPGIGQLMVNAFQRRDYPVAMAAILFAAVFFVVMNFVVDMVYAIINPKIRALYRRRVSVADV
jgi:peptide/nickel transport system permease protein